jgi:hypothetical protein
MQVKSAHKKHAQRSIIYLTFFLLLSIPVILFGLAQDDFDTRRKAFDDLQLSEENPCLISLPNVNPYTLEVDKTVTIQADAKLQDEGISQLQIFDSDETTIYEEDFEDSPIEIATSFFFTPKVSGKIELSGILTKTEGGSIECQITSPYGIRGLKVVPSNRAPEFISKPSESIPSQNIVTEDKYEYTLVATDADGDRINYSYSFTPRADWLRPTVIEDGSSGRLTIKFSGSSNKAASYLANVFIHDGYSKNLRSQSWVINVSPSENDIPIVTIIDPARSIRVDKGTTFKTAWEAFDLNHIIGYQLFITNNLANENQWIEIDKDIPYDTTSYNVDTSDLKSGTYKIIAKATDNQDPPGIGKGVSPEIVVSTITDQEPDTDDGVIIALPQITNMSPLSTEDVTNKRVTVRATIVASQNAQIDEDSIVFTLDDKDISNDIKINRISQQEYTLIYQPNQDLEEGLHKAKVSFTDTEGLETEKSWNFTIQEEKRKAEDTYLILGYEIGKNIVHIIGVGILTVILALITPLIIFSIWKDDREDPTKYTNTKLPPSIPSDDTKYIEQEDSSRIREKVEKEEITEEEQEDVWDKYSAPKPVITQEQKKKDLKDLTSKDKEPYREETETVLEPETKTQQEPEEPMPIIVGEKEKEKVKKKEKEDTPRLPHLDETTPKPEIKTQQEPEKSKPKTEQIPQEQRQTPQPEQPPVQQEPEIPEPEIPEISDLENISKQLQEIRANEESQEQNEEQQEEKSPQDTQ